MVESIEAMLAIIEAAIAVPGPVRFTAFDAISDLERNFEDDELVIEERLEAAERELLAQAKTDDGVRAGLIASVRAHPYNELRLFALGDLDDDESYALLKERAMRELLTDYHGTEGSWFIAYAARARGEREEEVRELLVGAFAALVERARTNQKESNLVNSVAFNALGFAIGRYVPPHPSIGPRLEQAFRVAGGLTEVHSHYALTLTTGPIALALAAHEHQTPALAQVLEAEGDGETHALQMRYAQWMLARDAASAISYLEDPEHADDKSLGMAAAVIADLHYTAGRNALNVQFKNRVTNAALAEARVRIRQQTAPPAVRDRMIWMFGFRSSTDRALGHEHDSEFVRRVFG